MKGSLCYSGWKFNLGIIIAIGMPLPVVEANPVVEVKADLEVTGEVSIGTSAQDASLHVVDTISDLNDGIVIADDTVQGAGVGGQIAFYGRYIGGGGGAMTTGAAIAAEKSNATSGNYSFDLGFRTRQNGAGGVTTERMRITADGNVGIGTTAPVTNVEIDIGANSADGLLLERAESSQHSARLFFRGSTGANTIARMYDRLGFRTGADPGTSSGTERMTILDSGEVGIGTTPDDTYDAILDVNGKIRLRVSGDLSGTGEPTLWAQDDNGTSRIYARDGDGNETNLASHKDPREIDPEAPSAFADPEVALPFSFAHSNPLIGKEAVVDMARVVKDLGGLTGQQYTYIRDMSPENVIAHAD